MGIDLLAAPPDDPYVVRNRRRPLSAAENYLLTSIQNLGIGRLGTIYSTELQALAPKVPKYMEQLEKHVSDKRLVPRAAQEGNRPLERDRHLQP